MEKGHAPSWKCFGESTTHMSWVTGQSKRLAAKIGHSRWQRQHIEAGRDPAGASSAGFRSMPIVRAPTRPGWILEQRPTNLPLSGGGRIEQPPGADRLRRRARLAGNDDRRGRWGRPGELSVTSEERPMTAEVGCGCERTGSGWPVGMRHISNRCARQIYATLPGHPAIDQPRLAADRPDHTVRRKKGFARRTARFTPGFLVAHLEKGVAGRGCVMVNIDELRHLSRRDRGIRSCKDDLLRATARWRNRNQGVLSNSPAAH